MTGEILGYAIRVRCLGDDFETFRGLDKLARRHSRRSAERLLSEDYTYEWNFDVKNGREGAYEFSVKAVEFTWVKNVSIKVLRVA